MHSKESSGLHARVLTCDPEGAPEGVLPLHQVAAQGGKHAQLFEGLDECHGAQQEQKHLCQLQQAAARRRSDLPLLRPAVQRKIVAGVSEAQQAMHVAHGIRYILDGRRIMLGKQGAAASVRRI